VSPSDEEGKGIDVCPDGESAVGFGKGRSETEVTSASVTAGEEPEAGVDAWSVARRSGDEEELGVKSPQPRTNISAGMIQNSFVLFIIPFNRLKIEFFAR
jgi:hypothetical protein